MRISCLCVTEDRAAFMPWLFWNYDRQSYSNRELVIIDSSTVPLEPFERPDVRVIRAPHRTNVPTKRNIAMTAACGDFFAWFDDDDWQHPDRLKILVANLSPRSEFVGGGASWFVGLHDGACFPHVGGGTVLFNGALFPRNVRDVRFREDKPVASDSQWMYDLRTAKFGERLLNKTLFFWLSHDRNISNPSSRWPLTRPISEVVGAMGEKAWGDTAAQLDELRARLGRSSPEGT